MLLRGLLRLAGPLALLLAGQTAAAQNTPTAEQIQALQRLTPEQQRALLESIQSGQSDRADQQLIFPPTTQPKLPTTEQGRETDQLTGRPRIRGGDTVLLNLQLTLTEPQTPPPAAPPTGPAPGQPAVQAGMAGTQTVSPVAEPQTEDPVRAAQAREELQRRARQFLPEEQIKAFDAADLLRKQAMAANPYKLDKQGQIWIPGLPAIPLAGLTDEQATERLAREPALELLTVKVTVLTLEPLGVDSLKPFGYDLFSTLPTTFAPATDIPVPAEYVVGPGDNLELQLVGNTKGRYTLVVGRDGAVRVPEIGPVSVAGLTFPEAQHSIETIVAEQMIGTRAVVGIGQLRSAQVLVTGDAERPGSYTVSGLSTISNVLSASGGVKTIGSLRTIELKRNGRVVSQLDVYDLLLHGDTRRDARVLSGDVVFIPPVGKTVSAVGEIRRPAIYEVTSNSTVGDLIALGGGLTPEADPQSARLERIDEKRGRVVLDVNLNTDAGRGTALRSGDILRLDPVRPNMMNSVTLRGHVYREGTFQYRPGMRLTDLLPGIDDLRPGADLHYVLIRRASGPELRISALSADMARAWEQPSSDANVALAPRDQVIVFDMQAGRERVLAPVLEELDRQGVRDAPPQTVGIGGRVRMPGQYPLEPGMTVSDLVRAGGSLDEAAFGGEAELTRYQVVNGQRRETLLIKIDLTRALAGDPEADVALNAFDFLVIKELSQWSEQETVTIEGEVQFPGRYPIKRGETMAAVLRRAGGLTNLAFIDGSVFTRKTLQEREGRQIVQLADRMQRDLAALAIQTSQVTQGGAQSAAQALVAGRSLLDELRKTQPVGRLVIDLNRVLKATPGSADDVVLKDGDRLVVPRQTQEVTVLGEVQSGTSHLYDPRLTRDDYVTMSGGLTQKADAKRIYIVRANGGVEAASNSHWFGGRGTAVKPGDTIVVPFDTERLPSLPMWTAVTTIIYNLAVAVAAVNSF